MPPARPFTREAAQVSANALEELGYKVGLLGPDTYVALGDEPPCDVVFKAWILGWRSIGVNDWDTDYPFDDWHVARKERGHCTCKDNN